MPERPVNPTDEDNIRAWIEAYQQDHQVALPARVQFYYAETQEADLVPVVKHSVPQPDGSYVYEDLPVLPHVPIIHPRTANSFIHLPIAAGDFVLVICTSACAEFWRAGDGSPQYPGDQRRNHLQNAVALPGLFPLGARPGSSPARRWPLAVPDPSRLVVGHTEVNPQSAVTTSAVITLGGGECRIDTSGNLVVNGGTASVIRAGDGVDAAGTALPPTGMVAWMAQVTAACNALTGTTTVTVPSPPSTIGTSIGGAEHFKG